jgi:hypothetical protein
MANKNMKPTLPLLTLCLLLGACQSPNYYVRSGGDSAEKIRLAANGQIEAGLDPGDTVLFFRNKGGSSFRGPRPSNVINIPFVLPGGYGEQGYGSGSAAIGHGSSSVGSGSARTGSGSSNTGSGSTSTGAGQSATGFGQSNTGSGSSASWPTIGVIKKVEGGPYQVGEPFTIEYTVINRSGQDLAEAVLYEILPDELEIVSRERFEPLATSLKAGTPLQLRINSGLGGDSETSFSLQCKLKPKKETP